MGVFTYELITGHTAFYFACKSSLRLYNAILNKEPLFNEDVWRTVSSECKDFIKLCLTKDQNDRPSVNELMKHPFVSKKGGKTDSATRAFLESNLRKNIENVGKNKGSSKMLGL